MHLVPRAHLGVDYHLHPEPPLLREVLPHREALDVERVLLSRRPRRLAQLFQSQALLVRNLRDVACPHDHC